MKHTQLLKSQLNAEEIKEDLKDSENDSIVRYEKIEGTPFTMGIYHGTYTVLFGNHRMTDVHETWEDAIEEIEERRWDMIMNIVVICMEKVKEDVLNNNKK